MELLKSQAQFKCDFEIIILKLWTPEPWDLETLGPWDIETLGSWNLGTFMIPHNNKIP